MNNFDFRKKSVLFLTLVILLSFIPLTLVNSANLKATIESCLSPTEPIIDGNFAVGEWKQAGPPTEITLFNMSNQDDYFIIHLMSVYDQDNRLFIGVTVPDPVIDQNDLLIIVFNTTAKPLIVNGVTIALGFYKDNDAKLMWVQNNQYSDELTDGVGFRTTEDVTAGGTADGIGKCNGNGTHINFEIRFPFNTGDIPGKDPILAIGDDIDIFIFYREGNEATDYSHYREADKDWDYNIIHIGCPTSATTIPIWTIISSLVGTIIIASIIKKRK